jgi:hypothetical protein
VSLASWPCILYRQASFLTCLIPSASIPVTS